MGMDLKPMRPSKDAPRYPANDPYAPGEVIWGRYNWSGWRWIAEHAHKWGVDVSEFDGCNDGKLIRSETCKAVADAIEKNLHTLDPSHRQWLEPHIALWRHCGGYRQY